MISLSELGFLVELVHLLISIFIATMTFRYLRKHGKKLGRGAIFLLLAVLFFAVFKFLEAIFGILEMNDFIIEKTFETAVLTFLAVALLIELKASEAPK